MAKKEAMTIEMATKEVHKWLDFKKYSQKKRENYEDAISTIAEGISDGVLVLNEDFSFTQTLSFPLGENGNTSTLTYAPRLKMFEIETYTSKVKAGNSQALIRGYVCALTKTAGGVLKDLDTEDNRIAQSIATFFL